MSIITQAFLIVSTVICVIDKQKKRREIKRIERKAEGNVKNNKTKNNLNSSISSKTNRKQK